MNLQWITVNDYPVDFPPGLLLLVQEVENKAKRVVMPSSFQLAKVDEVLFVIYQYCLWHNPRHIRYGGCKVTKGSEDGSYKIVDRFADVSNLDEAKSKLIK